MANFQRAKSEKKTIDVRRSRLRAHTTAHSSEQYVNIRSKSQRAQRAYAATPTVETKTNYKFKLNKRKRANSVGKKHKNRQYEQNVSKRHINSQYLSDQDTKITFTMENVQNTTNRLEETQELVKQSIQKTFADMIIKIKKQQLILENDLNDIVIKKKSILQSQFDELKKYKQDLNILIEDFRIKHDKNIVFDFLNNVTNKKYNVSSIQCAVSSNIMFNFDNEKETNKLISQFGYIESGEVPLFSPIIKVNQNNKISNEIVVKCFVHKNYDTQTLDITKFEVEYILLPKQFKTRWKKMKKTIFNIINDTTDIDDEKEQKMENNANSKTKQIIIEKNKNFKKNIVLINNLVFDCDYLIRCRCYNICGFSPWSVPKMVSIYDLNNKGHWKFNFEYFTDNMAITDNYKTITKTSAKNEWDALAKGPCFPINFIESQMKIYWNIKINNCHSADIGSLHFGIMSKKIKPENVWSESIGFAEYDSIGMEKYEKSPTFQQGSIVKIVVDFKLLTVEFYENDTFCAMQKLNVLKQKISDLCFGIGSYRKKNSITLT